MTESAKEHNIYPRFFRCFGLVFFSKLTKQCRQIWRKMSETLKPDLLWQWGTVESTPDFEGQTLMPFLLLRCALLHHQQARCSHQSCFKAWGFVACCIQGEGLLVRRIMPWHSGLAMPRCLLSQASTGECSHQRYRNWSPGAGRGTPPRSNVEITIN